VRRLEIRALAFVHDDWLDYGPRVDAWLELFTGPRRGRLAAPAEALLQMPTRVDFADAARYVFVSERTRRHAIEARGALPDTGIAHSGIDPSYLDSRPDHPWEWNLLYVGRIDERKGIATVLDALAQLPDELRAKGRVYELIHTVNSMRRDQGLELTDRIRLTVPADDADLLGEHGDWIRQETLAVSVDADGAAGLAIAKV